MNKIDDKKIIDYCNSYSAFSRTEDGYSFEAACSHLRVLPAYAKEVIDTDVYELIRAREEAHLRSLLFNQYKGKGAEFILKTKFGYVANKAPEENIKVTVNSGVGKLLSKGDKE